MIKDTLELIKVARTQPDDIIKAYTQPGSAAAFLQSYNLQAA